MGRFKWTRAGYAALMGSAQVQSLLDAKAEAVKAAADAGMSEGGYELEGHEVKDFQGKLARGRVVRTKTDQAFGGQAQDALEGARLGERIEDGHRGGGREADREGDGGACVP